MMFHRYLGALGPLPTLNEDKEHSGNTKPHPVQEYIWRTMADNNPQQVRRPLSGPPSHVAEVKLGSLPLFTR